MTPSQNRKDEGPPPNSRHHIYHTPVPDHHLDAGLGGGLQSLVGFVHAPASAVLPVDLQDLVAEAQPGQSGGGVGLHQLDKHPLREEQKKFSGFAKEMKQVTRQEDK